MSRNSSRNDVTDLGHRKIHPHFCAFLVGTLGLWLFGLLQDLVGTSGRAFLVGDHGEAQNEGDYSHTLRLDKLRGLTFENYMSTCIMP